MKYQISKALGLLASDKKIFEGFLYISLCKTCTPQGGGIFGPRAIMNNLGRGPLGEGMCQISKAWAFSESEFLLVLRRMTFIHQDL